MNRSCLFAMLLVAGLPNARPFAQAPQEGARDSAVENKKKEETCAVSGIVVTQAGGEPIKAATVRLKKADDPHQGYAAVSDASGHFEIKGAEPGRYRLEVARTGFVTQQFGQRTPDDPGALLNLSAGESLTDRIFRLISSAVIAGKIMDEDGRPLASTRVSAMREIYSEGKRKLQIQTLAETNDLGEYRLFGLSPGRYFLSALYSPSDQWGQGVDNFKDLGATKKDHGYVTTYYPGTPDPGKASPISVHPGEELRSMDMLLSQVGVFKVRGHVFNTVTHRPSSDVFLSLTSRNSRFIWNMGSYTAVQRDGSFEMHDVLSGSYIITAYWVDEGKPYTSRQALEVGNADVEGLSITIAQGVSIEGRLVWDGKPSVDEQELKVTAAGETADSWGGQARVLANGAFTLKDIAEGAYKLEVTGISQDCYVKNIRYGSSEASLDGFTVQRGGDATLQVTVSSRGARVKGNVVDPDGLPGPGFWIVLIPEDSRRGDFRLYKSKTTDQNGNFELRGIAPGDYKLFSWEQVESQAWEDPDFLKPFEEKGEKISFQDGDRKTQNLTAIRAQGPESPKP